MSEIASPSDEKTSEISKQDSIVIESEDEEEDGTDNELFFGLVCPTGTDKDEVIFQLQKALSNVKYKNEVIKITDLFSQIGGLSLNTTSDLPRDEYIEDRMNAGDNVRGAAKDGSALAKLSFIEVAEKRSAHSHENEPVPRMAYIFDSLKHPEEIEVLRRVYGKNFWLISAYSPENIREKFLAEEIRQDRHGLNINEFEDIAKKLIKRDQEDPKKKFGQKVIKTFHLGDVFVDSNNPDLYNSLERFVNLIFDDVDPTPTKDEYGMFYAKASAFRSGSLARQVGAAIISDTGDVLATGTNEVPNFGGGLCGPEDNPKQRESGRGFDSNTLRTIDVLDDFISKLKKEKWFSKEIHSKSNSDLVNEIMNGDELKTARLLDLTEYGREVHAEMAALMNASRQTISVDNSTLFCTTFPCHVCTKHIIASGIERVIYIEPYPKSLARELFEEQDGMIIIDKKKEPDKVEFQPFVGISPNRYMELFAWKEKKEKNGYKKKWDAQTANPRYWENSYQIIRNENIQAGKLRKKLSQTRLSV